MPKFKPEPNPNENNPDFKAGEDLYRENKSRVINDKSFYLRQQAANLSFYECDQRISSSRVNVQTICKEGVKWAHQQDRKKDEFEQEQKEKRHKAISRNQAKNIRMVGVN